MITKYKDFITENYDELLGWWEHSSKKPEDYGITNYTTNPDGSIDVIGDVNITDKYLGKLPIKFNKVTGNFSCFLCRLSTLENCPKEVSGSFSCNWNSITSLKYGPIKVGKKYECSSNNLISLEYAPKYVGRKFDFNASLQKEIYGEELEKVTLDDYPISIVGIDLPFIKQPFFSFNDRVDDLFDKVVPIVRNNIKLFEPLLDNKIAFHQMVMRLDPSLIQYYHTIPAPHKKTILFDI